MSERLRGVGDPGDHHDFQLSDDWQLTLKYGDQTTIMTLAELKQMQHASTEIIVECVSSGKISFHKPVTFTGVRFKDLVAKLAVPQDAQSVVFRSKAPAWGGPKHESHTTNLEWSYCLESPELLIVWAMDHEPLPKKNGGPLRTVVGADRYFYKSMKWLNEIEITEQPMEAVRGTWETYGGYHNYGRVAFEERFEPMMRIIEKVEDGADHTRPVSPEHWQATFEAAFASKNLSRLVVARLHEMAIDLNRDFRGVTFVDGDFIAKIRGTYFKKQDFTGVDFRRVNFSLTRFQQCVFSDVGKNPANLNGCDFEGAHFYTSDLRGVHLGEGAYLSGAYFYPQAALDKQRKSAKPALVEGLDLRGAQSLDPLQAEWLKLDGAVLDAS